MGRLNKRIKGSILVFLILSGFVHLSTLGIINLTVDSTKLQSHKTDTVEIEIKTTPDEKKLRLAEQDEKAVNDEVPEDAKFLSRHNQKVIKETRSKSHGDFRNSTGAGIAQRAQPQTTVATPQRNKKSAIDEGNMPSLSALNPKFNFSETRQKEVTSQNDSSAASASNDHLKDIAPGIETLLSSKEFVYYTYYQRIRSQIRQHWEPSIREKVRRIFAQGRSIASTRDHVTRVIIVLNKQGELIGVQVVGQSGVKDLDDAAVEAFRAAQPFPNPPKGIIDNDGTIKINWDFILEA